MLARVYALRPYVNIIKHSDTKFEVSILYMPYYRGVNYLITKISHQLTKSACNDGTGTAQVNCWLEPVGDLDLTSQIASDTYFIELDLKTTKYIDTVFNFTLVNQRELQTMSFKGEPIALSKKSDDFGDDNDGDGKGTNIQNSNHLGGSGGIGTP
ncbi:MAG: hypothetical protein KTR13_03050 [Saprospiraceae bacterium]|nr:hypothetical protein [Saprospiraceae bacterium]